MAPETEPARPVAAPDLSPGARVFVVALKDPLRERIDVRQSRVLHQEGDVLFLEQTDPPLEHAHSGLTLEIAALTPGPGGQLGPVGFVTRLLDVVEEFRVEESLPPAPALAVGAPQSGAFYETGLRMHYRVPVDPEMNVFVRLEGLPDIDEAELLDFSAGGARVRLDLSPCPDLEVRLGQKLPVKLLFIGSGYADAIGVVRSARRETLDGLDGEPGVEPGGAPRPYLTLGLCFTNMDIRDIRYLERMVARKVSACRQQEREAEYL